MLMITCWDIYWTRCISIRNSWLVMVFIR